MIVCICHRVTEHDIARHARAGLSFDDIQSKSGVATQCGQCEDCARQIVAQCRATPAVTSSDRESVTAIQLNRNIVESRSWRRASVRAANS